jgi:hypothetical protein
MLTLRVRLWMMLQGWGTVGLVYSIGRAVPGKPVVLHESVIDGFIPFDPSAVWFYLSFFALVPLAYLCAQPERVRPLTRAMQLCAVICAPVFVLWPTTLVYPPIPLDTASGALLHALAASDSRENCLPSLHGALTLLSVVALFDRRRPLMSAAIAIWGFAILWSVIEARRHLAIDLGAGVALGAACGWQLAQLGASSRAAPGSIHPAEGPTAIPHEVKQ